MVAIQTSASPLLRLSDLNPLTPSVGLWEQRYYTSTNSPMSIFQRSPRSERPSKTSTSTAHSSQLTNLIVNCRNNLPPRRPEIHTLHLHTKSNIELHRAYAYVEEATVLANGSPSGVFHNKVFFSKQDQDRFKKDMVFRVNYRRVNLIPLWSKYGMAPTPAMPPQQPSPVPPPMPPQEQQARPGIPPGDDEFIMVERLEPKQARHRTVINLQPCEVRLLLSYDDERANPSQRRSIREGRRRAKKSEERKTRGVAKRSNQVAASALGAGSTAAGGWWNRVPKWLRER